ncbi:MAG: hypothetical protein RQ753_08720, partial [Desulfurivibrionaceae bacterium]|nr:hypothetical protein [Desulfurivibrionaceae bacterium]
MLRVCLTRDRDNRYAVFSAEKQGSHMLTSLVDADGYVILEPEQMLRAGESVPVYSYDFRREPSHEG